MIKGNESDVGNIDFELLAKRGDKFLCFALFFEIKELFISLQPDAQLRWGLDQNVAFSMDKWFIFKNQNGKLPTCDSFLLIVSHISVDFWFVCICCYMYDNNIDRLKLNLGE